MMTNTFASFAVVTETRPFMTKIGWYGCVKTMKAGKVTNQDIAAWTANLATVATEVVE
jgi:hypothetical protein